LVGKCEGKRPLIKPRRRWEDNMRMHLREIGWEGVDWMNLAHDGDQWREHEHDNEHYNETLGLVKCGELLD
jgi:hypothetical protein